MYDVIFIYFPCRLVRHQLRKTIRVIMFVMIMVIWNVYPDGSETFATSRFVKKAVIRFKVTANGQTNAVANWVSTGLDNRNYELRTHIYIYMYNIIVFQVAHLIFFRIPIRCHLNINKNKYSILRGHQNY